MSKCVFAGSFDPITLGHVEVIKKATTLYDEVVVGLLVNWDKTYYFSQEERLKMIIETCQEMPSVTVKFFSGTLVDFLIQEKTNVFVRGIRNQEDLNYELLSKAYHQRTLPQIEYVFIKSEHNDISSSAVRQLIKEQKSVKDLVPECVLKYIK